MLKADRYFVREIENDSTNQAIVRAILTLAESPDLEVVAEGVESEAQIALLQRLKCTLFQGYHVSRPLPAAELLARLRQGRVNCAGITRAA